MTDKFWHTREDDLPLNRPELLELIPVKVLKAFYVKGTVVNVGEVVEIERHLGLSLQSLGKCEIVTEL